MDDDFRRGRGRARDWSEVRSLWLAVAVVALVVVGLGALRLRSGTDARRLALPTAQVGPGTTAPVVISSPPPPPTPAPPPATTPPPATAAHLGLPVTAVGDSVTIDIQPYLAARVPGVAVDGAVSRQWDTGVSILSGLRARGQLRPEVIVGLGINGGVNPAQFDTMMRAVAGAKRVVFVTVRLPRSWQDQTNATLRDGMARYPGTAVLADWYTLSANHPSWFAPDGVHLQTAGAQAMASLIAGSL
jgi:lysophospholipase L1-like esterase